MTCPILLMVPDPTKENVWQNAILLPWKKAVCTKAMCRWMNQLIKMQKQKHQDLESKLIHQHLQLQQHHVLHLRLKKQPMKLTWTKVHYKLPLA